MKKTHIILLILVIAGIVGMSFFIKDLTTQETFSSAAKKEREIRSGESKTGQKNPH